MKPREIPLLFRRVGCGARHDVRWIRRHQLEITAGAETEKCVSRSPARVIAPELWSNTRGFLEQAYSSLERIDTDDDVVDGEVGFHARRSLWLV